MWDDDDDHESAYVGKVKAYSEATEEHFVVYEDGDSKWHDLLTEETVGTLEWVDAPPYRRVAHHDDTTPHYVTYNADTRALAMYPDVTVLEDADVADVHAFAARLAGPPHFLYIPHDPEVVRQVCVKVSEPLCLQVPHACSQALAKLSAARGDRGDGPSGESGA